MYHECFSQMSKTLQNIFLLKFKWCKKKPIYSLISTLNRKDENITNNPRLLCVPHTHISTRKWQWWTCSSSYNLTPPISRVLIGPNLIFSHWRHQCAVTCLENVHQLNIRQYKKLGFQLSHRQPLNISPNRGLTYIYN